MCFVWITIACIQAWGQRPVFTYLREQEGLNDNSSWSSNAIHIDEHGFVWIATQSGINRFDGDQIRSFHGSRPAPYDLPYTNITAIAEDRNNILWLGTQEEGIILYNPYLETFTPFESRNRNADSIEITQVNKLQLDQTGKMIIGTAFQGFFRFDPDKNVLQKIKFGHDEQSNRSITNFLLLKDQRLVAITYKGIYLESRMDTFTFFPVDNSIFVFDGLEMPDGSLRFFTQNTNFHYRLNAAGSALTTHPNPDGKTICNCVIDPEGNLWINTRDGILMREDVTNGIINRFSAQTDIHHQPVPICLRGAYADRNGRIYYNSNGAGAGRWHYDRYPFETVVTSEANTIRMYRDHIILSLENRLMKLEDEKLSEIPLKKNSKGEIFDFIIDQDGSYWVQFDEPVPIFSHFDSTGQLLMTTTSERMFSQMVQLQDGRLTIGNKKHLNEKHIPYSFIGSFYEKLSGKSYPDFRVKYYAQLKNGDVWIATFASGIIRLTNNFEKYDMMPVDLAGNGKLNSNNPYYIYESRNGQVLVCTDKGINRWDPKTNRFSYITDDHIELQNIRGMVEGEDDIIWILMESRLWRYDLQDGSMGEFELHPDFRAAASEPTDLLYDRNGFVYYLGTYGLVRVDPVLLENQPPPTSVLFTDLYVDRKRIYPGDESNLLDTSILYQHSLDMQYGQRDIGFTFVSPNGKDVNAKYYYKLDGYKDEWMEAPADKTIHFTSLAPGSYTFEVKAKSGNGKWTSDVSAIDFYISPPWYQQWWAYVLYTLAASGVAYTFYRYRVNELLKYQFLRTKISSDLHDDVGTILGSIAMEAEMLAYDSDPVRAPLLQRLSDLSREAMGRMRDTVWAIDSRKDNLEFLTDRMKDYLAETLSRSAFSYTWEDTSGMQGTHISPDVRQNVYLIFKEAINNVLRHSNGNIVIVSLTKEKSGFTVKIRDNGTMHKIKAGSGQGMSNMKMRAEMINAHLSFLTQDGFEVVLKFDISSSNTRW